MDAYMPLPVKPISMTEVSQPAPLVTIEVGLLGQNPKGQWLVALDSYEGIGVHAWVDTDCLLPQSRQANRVRILLPCLATHDDYAILLLPEHIHETQTRFLKVNLGKIQH